VGGLNTVQLYRLEHACSVVATAFGSPPYLVGSAASEAQWRDVDVRSILPDAEWDALFAGREAFWSLVCLAVSVYLSEVTGLPVDFQIQRQTEANTLHPHKFRNPMGHGYRWFAGGGDATPTSRRKEEEE
jgi:hypothetical protein